MILNWQEQHPMKINPQTSHPKPILHILYAKNKTKNLVENEKRNPQAKTLVLTWNNQIPNGPTNFKQILIHKIHA